MNLRMNGTTASRITALLGMMGVVLGAFGAHGLKGILEAHGTTDIWEKAVFYHFVHAVMMYVLSGRAPFRAGAWWSFLGGILVFSGTLYLLAVTNQRWLGAITPIGGLSFIVGWCWLIFASKRATVGEA